MCCDSANQQIALRAARQKGGVCRIAHSAEIKLFLIWAQRAVMTLPASSRICIWTLFASEQAPVLLMDTPNVITARVSITEGGTRSQITSVMLYISSTKPGEGAVQMMLYCLFKSKRVLITFKQKRETDKLAGRRAKTHVSVKEISITATFLAVKKTTEGKTGDVQTVPWLNCSTTWKFDKSVQPPQKSP